MLRRRCFKYFVFQYRALKSLGSRDLRKEKFERGKEMYEGRKKVHLREGSAVYITMEIVL